MTNKIYDTLRWVQDILPIIGTMTTTLLALYGVGEPTVAIVGGTFTAVTVAIVSILRVAKERYNEQKGETTV